ncbi:hypothetical protein GOV11_04855 [Candidatus Woesearchaeota archaeon]|nr:hypothetical protein [Candidatus Woesearchaeota archaeon]
MKTDIVPSYSVRSYFVTYNDILKGKFVQLGNRRKTRPGAVKELYNKLTNGQHFETPLVINERDSVWRLVDGNHRLEAIKRYLLKNTTDRVKVTLHIFNNLDDDDEKDLFTTVNKGSKQNTNDVVKQYEDEIPSFSHMKNGWQSIAGHHSFACNVSAYPTPSSVSYYRLVGAYLASQESTFGGGYIGSAFDFIDEAKKLKLEDVQIMNAFMMDFISAFGNIKNNEFIKTTPFFALMRIWMDNKERLTPPQLISRFKTKIRNDPVALLSSRGGGSGATMVARTNFVQLLNAGRTRYLFV